MDISGRWQGYYEYGQGYRLPQFGQRVNFEMILKEEDDSFEGEITEEKNEYSIDENALVSGFIQNGLVSFIKKYPNPDDVNSVLNDKSLGLEIEYLGQLDEANKSIYGTWKTHKVAMSNGDRYQVMYSGIWLVKKY